jgi:hypothetical protein
VQSNTAFERSVGRCGALWAASGRGMVVVAGRSTRSLEGTKRHGLNSAHLR